MSRRGGPTSVHREILTTQELIIGAAREVAHTHGCAAMLKDIQTYSGLHKSTIYEHFGSNARTEILRQLGHQIVGETRDMAFEIIDRGQSGEDGRKLMLDWTYHGFRQVEKYGKMAVQMCFPEDTPEWIKDLTKWDEMLRFTGWLVKLCQAQGHCRRDARPRSVVRVYYTLCHPHHTRWGIRDGLTYEEMREETLDNFFRIYAKDYCPVEAGFVDR